MESFIKRYMVERTNKAEIRSEEQSEKVEAYHQVPSTKKKKKKSLGQPENMSHFPLLSIFTVLGTMYVCG